MRAGIPPVNSRTSVLFVMGKLSHDDLMLPTLKQASSPSSPSRTFRPPSVKQCPSFATDRILFLLLSFNFPFSIHQSTLRTRRM